MRSRIKTRFGAIKMEWLVCVVVTLNKNEKNNYFRYAKFEVCSNTKHTIRKVNQV